MTDTEPELPEPAPEPEAEPAEPWAAGDEPLEDEPAGDA
jgi:hypothetical protein